MNTLGKHMENTDSALIQDLIDQHLTKFGKDFATLRQILDNRALLKILALKTSTPQHAVITNLQSYLGSRFRVYQIGKKNYIGRNQADKDLVLKAIVAQSNPKTLKQWSQYLPLTKPSLLEAVNNLLVTGQISVSFNASMTARLIPVSTVVTVMPPAELSTPQEGDMEAFRAAYDKIRGGKDIVRIHKIREYLNWSVARFNEVLATLRADYQIDLHLGDPSRLTSDEVKNSYIDPHGMLYIGLSWR